MIKLFIFLIFLPTFLIGMDGLTQRSVGKTALPHAALQEETPASFAEYKKVEQSTSRSIGLLCLGCSAAIFIGGFSHLMHRIEVGTLACDRQLLAELGAIWFFVPMADEYGTIMERAAGKERPPVSAD